MRYILEKLKNCLEWIKYGRKCERCGYRGFNDLWCVGCAREANKMRNEVAKDYMNKFL